MAHAEIRNRIAVKRLAAVGPAEDATHPPAGNVEVLALGKLGAVRATYDSETHHLAIGAVDGPARLGFDLPSAPDGVRLSADGRVATARARK